MSTVNSQKQKTLESIAVTLCPQQQLTDRMVHDLTHENQQTMSGMQIEHQLAITDCANQIRAIQHENVGLQDEIRAKDQQIAAFQRHYVDYLTNEYKNNRTTIIEKST